MIAKLLFPTNKKMPNRHFGLMENLHGQNID